MIASQELRDTNPGGVAVLRGSGDELTGVARPQKSMNIVVFGANGPTGQLLVRQGLAELGAGDGPVDVFNLRGVA